ncbi:TolC family protein [Photobacterium japonica]|uniref:TolC family protein n=1 Tax=Photobacterium japonica TaxID=2910235 RepID=UPI003D13E362
MLYGVSGTLSAPVLAADLLHVVDAALAQNLTLSSAETGLRASQYDVDVNRAKFLPSLGVSANTNWNDGLTHKEQGGDVSNRYNDHGINITLSQTLFDLGDLYSQGNAHIGVDIETLKTEQTRQRIIREASTTYFEYLKNGAKIRATQAEFDSSVSRLTLINRNIELGNVAGTERYEVLAQKERTANTLRTLNKDRRVILSQLENIVQQRLVPDFDLQSSLQFHAISTDRQRTLNDILYRSGFDLRIAQQTVNQRRQTLKETGADFAPSLKGSIGYSYNNSNEATATLFPDNGTTEETVYTLTLDIPLVDGGRDYYRYQQNKVNITQSEIDLQDSKQRSQQQFDTFIYDINDFSASLQSLTTIIQANYASYIGIQKAHKLGTRTITDLLSAESKLFSSIRDYESARYDYIIALVQLNELIGNLNKNTIGKIAEQMSPMSDKNADSPIPLHVLTQ